MEAGDGGGDRQGDGGGEKRDIRRPMNAFLIFCKRHRSIVRAKHPERDNRSVTRILGDLWANLPNNEKAVYTNLAKQYKDAFMKANPDYKWHSTDRLPQPAKMATRPTNVRPPRSVSPSDSMSSGHTAEGDKLVGLNLLLMAGQQQSMPGKDKPGNMSHILERRATSPDLMRANSALLQLAEMCSTELNSRQSDMSPLCSAPPKKRARHWSSSDADSDKSKIPTSSLLFQTIPNPSLSIKPHPPSATQTSQLEEPSQKDSLDQTSNQSSAILQRKEKVDHHLPVKSAHLTDKIKPDVKFTAVFPEEKNGDYKLSSQTTSQPGPTSPVIQPQARPVSSDVGIPPKKKFTKLQDHYRPERPPPAATTTTTTTTGSGCLSDQNDNAIFTCGKLVVNHIIDRLFSANFANNEQSEPATNPSSTDIEKVRKIITADMTEREKSQGPSSKDMGRLLSEVVQKPQNLVEKVIEEAYSLDLKQIAKLEPSATSAEPQKTSMIEKTEPKQNRLVARSILIGNQNNVSKLDPIQEHVGCEARSPPSVKQEEPAVEKLPPSTTPLISAPSANSEEAADAVAKYTALPQTHVKDEKEERYSDDILNDPNKDDNGDFMLDDDDCYSQPVRKSRRRNRGQRYQELINEGIIQPSKERLAARRHEQVPISLSNSILGGEEMRDDDALSTDKQRLGVKRSISESDSSSALDEKRYRTGDFDLEAEIATLPPCSLDQVPRRRGPRKRSDSEGGRRQAGSPIPGQTKEESGAPRSPLSSTSSSQLTGSSEPLTGSQKRKARKHSINRLVASSDTGSNARPPGIEASIPMVRDATLSPAKAGQVQPASEFQSSSMTATSPPTSACLGSTTNSSEGQGTELLSQGGEEEVPVKMVEVKETDYYDRTSKTVESEHTMEKNVAVVEVKSRAEMTGPRITGSEGEDNSGTDSRTVSLAERQDDETSVHSYSAAKPEVGQNAQKVTASRSRNSLTADDIADSTGLTGCGVNPHSRAAVVNKRDAVVDGDVTSGVHGVQTNISKSSCEEDVCTHSSVKALQTKPDVSQLLQERCTPVTTEQTDCKLQDTATNVHCQEKQSIKFQQMKGKFSRDSALGSSTEQVEEADKDSDPSFAEASDKPQVFLSETSGLLCTAETLAAKDCTKTGYFAAEIMEYTSDGSKSSLESVFDGSEEKVFISQHSLSPVSELHEDKDGMVSSLSNSAVQSAGKAETVDTSNSRDRGSSVIMTVSSSGCLSQDYTDMSPFTTSGESSTGPRVTTVAMTASDAMPTALMMEEDALDSSLGTSVMCGSPLPS